MSYKKDSEYKLCTSLESRRGGGGKERLVSLLFEHALNYYIKPRGFMQMTSQIYPSVNNDVYTTQRNHEDMITALTLTFGTWSVINTMREETTMTTLSFRACFTSNTNGI